ncbi:uncharacterized protein LOC119911891 [Micropterus salmoides]|uniref:uncharacterized protein LOC119911891 n=1 Tax=Micropterus salmoides TaxID=27706 RepID=UPI0018EADACE|nr:uncharacterized protein LOC119911891 [Micropterus salmoides]
MMNFTLVTALLCTFSWISVSVSEFHTVEVQPGEEVTLMCSNFTSTPSHINWFRLNNRPNASCISSMFSSDTNATFCDGFQNSKFNMTSNTTTIFLKIKQVDLSDSELYFCGFYSNGNSVIVSATYLKVQGSDDSHGDVDSKCESKILLKISFIVQIIKCFKVHTLNSFASNFIFSQVSKPKIDNNLMSDCKYFYLQNLGSDALTYAALSFRSKAKSSRRPASENQLETNVVYAATR